MTLGEFRKRTAELPDDAEVIIVNCFNDKPYGKLCGDLTITPANSTKVREGADNYVFTPDFIDGMYGGFFVENQTELQKMNLSKVLVIMKGDYFYVD